LISDQSPRGACSDETMTATAEAALAADEAVPGRIIGAGREGGPWGPVKRKRRLPPSPLE